MLETNIKKLVFSNIRKSTSWGLTKIEINIEARLDIGSKAMIGLTLTQC
jgi:hypothetical protein